MPVSQSCSSGYKCLMTLYFRFLKIARVVFFPDYITDCFCFHLIFFPSKAVIPFSNDVRTGKQSAQGISDTRTPTHPLLHSHTPTHPLPPSTPLPLSHPSPSPTHSTPTLPPLPLPLPHSLHSHSPTMPHSPASTATRRSEEEAAKTAAARRPRGESLMKKEPRPVTFLEQREAPDHAQRRAITINSKRHVGARTPVIHQKASCTAAAAPHVVMEPLIFMKGVGDLFKVPWGYFARFLGGELGRRRRGALTMT